MLNLVKDPSAVASDLVSAGTAFAGLILVFLGVTLAAWDSYGAVQQKSVRWKFRRRGLESLLGFVFSLAAVVFGFASGCGWGDQEIAIYYGLACLGVSLILMVVASGTCVLDLF